MIGMFKRKCDYCHEKDVWVFGKDKLGTFPKAYCTKKCETNAKYERRFDNRYDRQ
jgi:hypothetical protein